MVYMGVSTEMCKSKPSTKGWPRPNQCCLNTIETLPPKKSKNRQMESQTEYKLVANKQVRNWLTNLTLLSLISQHPHKRLRPRHRKARQRAEGFVQSRVAPYVERGSTWLPSEWVGLHSLNPEDPWKIGMLPYFTSQDGIQLAIQLQKYGCSNRKIIATSNTPEILEKAWRSTGIWSWWIWLGTSCKQKYMAYVSVWNWRKNLECTD